ncbi:ABC transporter permease [bacterium LRH843]|nr:ABC transporter permease [bacterium LRH843]
MTRRLIEKLAKRELAGVILPVIIISLVLNFVTEGFLTPFNLDSLARTVAITSIVGLSQLLTLSIGQFNLALGAMGATTGMLLGFLLEAQGVPVMLAILIGLAAGSILGMVQGILIVKTGINPFIITLALASVFLGIATAATRGQAYFHLPESFNLIGKLYIFNIPLLLIIAILVAVVVFLIIQRTPLGRQILATGANQRAALFSGINTNTIIITVHTLSGTLAGLAGMLQVARLGSAQLSIGADWLLVSFAAPVLGGTLLSGGKVTVFGTLFGAVLMAIIINGLVLINISSFWFQLFLGIILLAAFEVNRIRLQLLGQKGI